MLTQLFTRLLLGRRLPTTAGELRVPGLSADATIRRDRHGVPHIEAASDADAWFALGFCHAQDRGFQLEVTLRFGRGTLAAMLGRKALPADRLSRRLGFGRNAPAQLAAQDDDLKGWLAAYAAGVNAGFERGGPLAHEFAILRTRPTPWQATDVLAFLSSQSFLMASNWDAELARFRTLRADGPDAVRALDPAVGAGLDAVAADLERLRGLFPAGGGSNNWVIRGDRTGSGRPILANDPHLAPTLPAPWYLAHLRTPEWEVMGATFVGAPAVPVGHNGFCAWGVTAALTDNADLWIEAPDAGEVVREEIAVRGGKTVVEEVRITPRGPILTPLLRGETAALSIQAVYLEARKLRGFVDAPRARSFEQFRRPFAHWPVMQLNVVYADVEGNIGYQLVGELPRRGRGNGTLPLPADTPGAGWQPGGVPFEAMPFVLNPPEGFWATANNPPPTPEGGPFLGVDFLDSYRFRAIREALALRPEGWTADDCLRLQLSVRSIPWEEMRETVLAIPVEGNPDAAEGLALLREWDGQVSARSAAATVWELWLAEMAVRFGRASAPNGGRAMLGELTGPVEGSFFGVRRVAHLSRLIREGPPPEVLAHALAEVVRALRRKFGPGRDWWEWADTRPLTFRHLTFGKTSVLRSLFNRGPVPFGGDANTVNQGGGGVLKPLGGVTSLPNLRCVLTPGDWEGCRWVLAGGQSGNPLSPHADDLLELWAKGEAVTLPWAPAEVLRQTAASLRLRPPVLSEPEA